MKVDKTQFNCSFCKWYPLFTKNTFESVIIPIPEKVCKYLEHDAFLLPIEATKNSATVSNSEWSDGTQGDDEPEEDSEKQPSFPEFSKQIQDVIDDFDEVFVKLNWSSPSDAMWVSMTKSLKCNTLEDVYLLLKSSDRITEDLTTAKNFCGIDNFLKPCLVLKRWREINPCNEFRCFVVKKELVGICQRDTSQFYKHIANEKFDIITDIKSLFMEKIRDRFPSENYSFDVIRYKKDKVKILDFGPLNEAVVQTTIFSLEDLYNLYNNIAEAPEFRFIAEDIGIQPKSTNHFCIPKEIFDFFKDTGDMSMMDAIQKEVQEQGKEDEQAN